MNIWENVHIYKNKVNNKLTNGQLRENKRLHNIENSLLGLENIFCTKEKYLKVIALSFI